MKRWIWTNLWKLERRPPHPSPQVPSSIQPPTNLRKSQNVAFPGDFALRVEKSNSKIIQKLKLPQKPKCTSKYPTSHSEKGSQWIMELEQRACIGYFLKFSLRMDWILFHYFYSALLLPQRLLVAFPAKLALQCCFQIFTEMRINFQVVSKLNSLYFKNHQNFVSGSAGNRPTLRLL